MIESSGEKAKTWGRKASERPKLRNVGPATYLYRAQRVDVSNEQIMPGQQETPKLLKRITGVMSVGEKWKWEVEWDNEAGTAWVEEDEVRGNDRDKLWEFLTMAMDAATPDT